MDVDMMQPSELSGRKTAILRTLVHHYIRTGEPVGSEIIAASAALGVSSATIRNELAALEEMGYLTQPHTSAGRAPTDRAYRYYVDLLPNRPRLRDPERRQIVHFFDLALNDVDEILKGTTQLLSRLTRYASLALAPSVRVARIARAELVPLGSGTLLLVVFDTGRVEKRMVGAPSDLDAEDGRRLTTALEAMTGRTLQEAVAEARAHSGEPTPAAPTWSRVAEALASIDEAAEAEHVVVGGAANFASEQSFRRRETLREIFEALERESEVLTLLRGAAAFPSVSVTIGAENPLTGMWDASVVVAPFDAGGQSTGSIGVVGPTRMDYPAAISAVQAVALRLSAAVEALGGTQ
jgi:heat-inducible transcriptional repressor